MRLYEINLNFKCDIPNLNKKEGLNVSSYFLQDDDKKAGGITLARYQELYAQFIGNPDETCNACYLFGPLQVIE